MRTITISARDYLALRAAGWKWGIMEAESWVEERGEMPDWTRGQFAGYFENCIASLPDAEDGDDDAADFREAYLAACEEVLDDAASAAWESMR